MFEYYSCHVELQNNALSLLLFKFKFENTLSSYNVRLRCTDSQTISIKYKRSTIRHKWYFKVTQEKPEQKILSVKLISHLFAFKNFEFRIFLAGEPFLERNVLSQPVAATVIIYSFVPLDNKQPLFRASCKARKTLKMFTQKLTARKLGYRSSRLSSSEKKNTSWAALLRLRCLNNRTIV